MKMKRSIHSNHQKEAGCISWFVPVGIPICPQPVIDLGALFSSKKLILSIEDNQNESNDHA